MSFRPRCRALRFNPGPVVLIMLLLIFKADENQYALETTRVLRVLPRVALRKCPGAPAYIAGILNYRGAPVAVVDLGQLLNNSPCRQFLSTRIILAEYTGKRVSKILLGLMAEGATSIMHKDNPDFIERPLNTPNAAFQGKMFRDGERLIQLIKIEEIAPAELEQMLADPPAT